MVELRELLLVRLEQLAGVRWAPAHATADVHLTMGWDTFARLSAGRGAPGGYAIWVSGDEGLAQRVLVSLNVAP